MRVLHPVLFLPLALLLHACAATPDFDTAGIDTRLTPLRAVENIPVVQGTTILWGGVIIASSNLQDATQFEILAYPLDDKQRPDVGQNPLGRFLATRSGYLETADYAQGRLLTIKGAVVEKRVGRIGEADYVYPLVTIEQLHLWPMRGDDTESRIQFGIGVMFHN